MSPKVSVVMPAYRAEATVGAAISSVLWQTHRELDLIVVDDGSDDATASIVAAYGERVRLITQENRGVAAARNRGIQEASGQLIALCDADDVLFEQHVEALIAVHEVHGGIATANSYWLFPRGIHRSKTRYKGRFPRPEEQRRAILEQNFVSTMSLFPRRLVDEIGLFDERRRRAEDWDFWLRAIFDGWRVSLQPEPLALYRWGTRGLSSGWQEMDEDIASILRQVGRRPDLTPDEREYVRRRLAGPGPRRLSRDGDDALRGRRYAEAARSYREAAALCPSERMLVWKARTLAAAPRLIGPLVRARQLSIESKIGFEPGHRR